MENRVVVQFEKQGRNGCQQPSVEGSHGKPTAAGFFPAGSLASALFDDLSSELV